MSFRVCAFSVAAGLAVLFGSFGVEAATVSHQAGAVLVSKGKGFVPISGSVEMAPGGRVMVRPGGLATITYGGNCTVRVGSGFWLVNEASPCVEGTTEIDFTTRMAGGALDPPPPAPRHDRLVIGGVIVGGAIAACVFWWCRDHDSPISP